MRFSTLEEWLRWQERLHPRAIDLGLERVASVWRRLDAPLEGITVVTVAGTNGKGSTIALLEAILEQAGISTGSYTSPHLVRYNERIRLDGEPVADETLLEAFDAVDRARGERLLTYFEFGTLAALWILSRQRVEVALLEVGLGGRLDAVNILDADLAMITSIDLDHQAWLGDDREVIGREKAGIFRPGRPAVFSAPDMPASVGEVAAALGTPLHRHGVHFHLAERGEGWSWWSGSRRF
ncbi:MAG TPA: bifunctional tetrahydrofolate synthase/dihydrofolate synthase, partial [Chromatiales bacterium]|nr:bifunctional tetrahydrofolate synthase/dihydrofolate synthase [Chromatiales bacterium]